MCSGPVCITATSAFELHKIRKLLLQMPLFVTTPFREKVVQNRPQAVLNHKIKIFLPQNMVRAARRPFKIVFVLPLLPPQLRAGVIVRQNGTVVYALLGQCFCAPLAHAYAVSITFCGKGKGSALPDHRKAGAAQPQRLA